MSCKPFSQFLEEETKKIGCNLILSSALSEEDSATLEEITKRYHNLHARQIEYSEHPINALKIDLSQDQKLRISRKILSDQISYLNGDLYHLIENEKKFKKLFKDRKQVIDGILKLTYKWMPDYIEYGTDKNLPDDEFSIRFKINTRDYDDSKLPEYIELDFGELRKKVKDYLNKTFLVMG